MECCFYQLCLHQVANLIVLLDFARQGISEGVWRMRDEIVDSTMSLVRLWLFNSQKRRVDLQSLGISKERMHLARLHGGILIVQNNYDNTANTTPVNFRTRRQIASASNSGSRMAFGGDGSGGGNIAPSLELATAPVAVEVGEEDLVMEEDIVGTVEGGAFGEAVDAVVDGLRTMRALGGMDTVVGREEGDGGKEPVPLAPTYASHSFPSSSLEPSRRPFPGMMDVDSYDHVDAERNCATSNSDRYLIPVECQSPLC